MEIGVWLLRGRKGDSEREKWSQSFLFALGQ